MIWLINFIESKPLDIKQKNLFALLNPIFCGLTIRRTEYFHMMLYTHVYHSYIAVCIAVLKNISLLTLAIAVCVGPDLSSLRYKKTKEKKFCNQKLTQFYLICCQ